MNGNMTPEEKDTLSREKIVSEIDKNFFVEAGAGSGKTTMLVNRMVAMVEAGIPIERICAITFTKAAAGEFYDRFQKALSRRSLLRPENGVEGYAGDLQPSTPEKRARCEAALQNIDLCFMGTIDAFCARVLAEHPFEAGIPSDSRISSPEEVETIYRQQYVKISGGQWGKSLADLGRAFRALFWKPEEVFVEGAAVFMEHRDAHFNFKKPKVTDIGKHFAKERRELLSVLRFLSDHPELAYERKQNSRAAWEKLPRIIEKLERKWAYDFQGVINSLKGLKNLRLVPEALEHNAGVLADWFELGGERNGWLEFCEAGLGALLGKLGEYRYGISMAFLEACRPILEQAMRDKGCMTFFDNLYYLRNMLREDAKKGGGLIRYIYGKHSYFLIDECQDTNPLQTEIFFYLTAEHPVESWHRCVPRPGSLFIVGDPKQSIYRFRSADVASFQKTRELFEGKVGEILSLPRNFRSTRLLCEYFNRVFMKMLPDRTENQSPFEMIPLPEETKDEFQGIYTYTAYMGQAAADNPEETDPLQIARIIWTLVGNERFKLRGEGDQRPRQIQYGDIMVITQGKPALRPIMAKLDEFGIPTRVEGDVPFGSNEGLWEVYKIYAALADGDDGIALYGALTGRLLGLSEAEILRFKAEGGYLSLRSLTDRENCRKGVSKEILKKLELLKSMYDKAVNSSPAAVFSMVMDDLRIYRTVEADNLEVLYYTLELLRYGERSGLIVTLKDGRDYLERLLEGDADEERCLSLSENPDCVHMANLHKVKGLEAPVVILAAAGKVTPDPTIRIQHDDAGTEGYLFALPGPGEGFRRSNYFETSAYESEKTKEEAAQESELLRLIYVAGTRARNALILCSRIAGKKGSPPTWAPIMESDCRDFFAAFGQPDGMEPADSQTKESASALYEEAEKTCALNHRETEECTYSVKTPSFLRTASRMADEPEDGTIDGQVEEAPVPAPEGRKLSVLHKFPALLGTMTHRMMEMLVSARNQVDAAQAAGEIVREYRTSETAAYEKELSDALQQVAKRMCAGGYDQENGAPRDILSTLLDADEVFCEVPFCYRAKATEEEILGNGIMDVVYRKGNRWHIIDYKTNADGNDLDKRYEAQLDEYRKAFFAITGEEADARTYHIDI